MAKEWKDDFISVKLDSSDLSTPSSRSFEASNESTKKYKGKVTIENLSDYTMEDINIQITVAVPSPENASDTDQSKFWQAIMDKPTDSDGNALPNKGAGGDRTLLVQKFPSLTRKGTHEFDSFEWFLELRPGQDSDSGKGEIPVEIYVTPDYTLSYKAEEAQTLEVQVEASR